jgi:hypothetical protein
MCEAIDAALVRSGTWGSLWIDGEQVAECYGCQAKISKTKESVPRCRAMMEDSKLVSTKGTGSIRIYNVTSRLIELEGEALKTGKDLRHTIISNLDDPDNPNNQRIALMGEVARVACRARLVGMECRVVVDEEARACNR